MTFYRDVLGFDVTFRAPAPDPFFAIVRRDGVQLFLKFTEPDVAPGPNAQQHRFARWDAFVSTPA